MPEINKLPTQVINQIAAGEVVERPASVVKELVENAIDAGATVIDIEIEQGGLEKIEIRDNGKGIDPADLPNAFERYATSKLSTIEDLQSLLSYGFRGEALAAIGSVSTTSITSKRGDIAYTITSTNDTISTPTPASRAQGTTVTVEKLFNAVPARQKFLKSADTEYRYVLEMFQYFALLNGRIHFTLTHNGKQIHVFPATTEEYFPLERVATIYKIDKSLLLPINHDEFGMQIRGVLVHPKALSTMSKIYATYVNKRPINDRGIFKSMQQGIAGFVPENYKAAGLLAVFMPPEHVDVNVHPRKMEVKFLNPFRVYAAITHAVKMCLETNVSAPDRRIGGMPTSTQFQGYDTAKTAQSYESNWDRRSEVAYDRLRSPQTNFFSDNSQYNYSTDTTTSFTSKETENNSHIPEYIVSQSQLHLSEADIIPVLGRYILVAFMDELWVVDQHAAAERVRFEQFRKAYLEGLQVTQQSLLTPLVLPVTEQDGIILKKNLSLFTRLGFSADYNDESNQLRITAVPVSLQHADIQRLVQDTVTEMSDHFDTLSEPTIGMYATEHDLSLVIATMACHNSVRMNQRITVTEAKSIVQNLLECEIPFACPHGRKAIWRLQKEDIDKEFMRT